MNPQPRKRDVQGVTVDGPTQFASHGRSEPADTGLGSLIGNIDAEGGRWMNGGQGSKLTIVEKDIAERDRNYQVTFDSHGWMEFNPTEFGVFDPDGPTYGGDRDRIYLGVENYAETGKLQLQYVAGDSDFEFEEVGEDLDDETREEVESEILTALQERYGRDVDVQFTSSVETWGDIGILYNRVFTDADPAHKVTADGKVTFDVCNIMYCLEGDTDYISIRDGEGFDIIRDVLRNRGLY